MIHILNKENTILNKFIAQIRDKHVQKDSMRFRRNIERIGDHAENIAEYAIRRVNEEIPFSVLAEEQLEEMRSRVMALLNVAQNCFHTRNHALLSEAVEMEDEIDDLERDLQQNHVDRLAQGLCTPQSGMIFSDMLSNLERVADHATNIAFSITKEEQPEVPKEFAQPRA